MTDEHDFSTLISALSKIMASFTLAPGPILTPLPMDTFGPIYIKKHVGVQINVQAESALSLSAYYIIN